VSRADSVAERSDPRRATDVTTGRRRRRRSTDHGRSSGPGAAPVGPGRTRATSAAGDSDELVRLDGSARLSWLRQGSDRTDLARRVQSWWHASTGHRCVRRIAPSFGPACSIISAWSRRVEWASQDSRSSRPRGPIERELDQRGPWRGLRPHGISGCCRRPSPTSPSCDRDPGRLALAIGWRTQ